MSPSIRRQLSSAIRTELASAAWKKAIRVRISHPLAASCGNSRIGSGPLALPPEYISSAMKNTSPDQKRQQQRGQRNEQRLALHPQKGGDAEQKVQPARGDEGVGKPRSPAMRKSMNSAVPSSSVAQTAR